MSENIKRNLFEYSEQQWLECKDKQWFEVNEQDWFKCNIQDHLNPCKDELKIIAKFIMWLGLKVSVTLDSESEVNPFPNPKDEIDDINDGLLRFGNTYIPFSRVDVINIDFGFNWWLLNWVVMLLCHLLEALTCNYYCPHVDDDIEALRKLLFRKAKSDKEIGTIHSVREDLLPGSIDKKIGPIGFSTVLIPYREGASFKLAVLSLKNIRLIEFV